MDVSPRRCQVAPHRLLVASLSESSGKPLKTLVQTVTRGGAGRLDILSPGLAQTIGIIGPVVERLTQARCLRLWSPSLSVISAAFMAFCDDG